MTLTRSFRQALARRLLQIAVGAAPFAVGCGTTDPTRNCGAPIGGPTNACFVPPGADAGVFTCPSSDEAQPYLRADNPGLGFFSVDDGPTEENGLCCYTVQRHVDCTGRPFLVGGRALAATARAAAGWSESLSPRVEGLAPDERAQLAARWTRDALGEHASIASFARFALELLAVGAPAELVELAHRAALDEVRHARLCFALASAYAGSPVGPGDFPVPSQLAVSADLASVAVGAAREGCIEETCAALDAERRMRETDDPVVRDVLAVIAEDEARHAELAWRTVAWAVAAGGEPVRRAVAAVFADLDEDEVVGPAARALVA